MTAAEVIEEARDHHGSFDGARIPPRVALRALSRLMRRLASKVTDLSEDALAVPHEIDLATLQAALENREGIVLPPHLLVLGNVLTWRLDRPGLEPVELVAYSTAQQFRRFPAAVLHGSRIYPVNMADVPGYGNATTGWEGYQGLKLTLVPLPEEMDVLTDDVPLPDVAKDALVLGLAVFMAGRSGAAVVSDLPLLAQQALDAEAAAVSALAAMDTTTRWTIQRH